MSIEDVQSRMLQIQSRMAELQGATASTQTSGSSAAFASALSGATSSVSGEQVVADAKQYLGVPYVWGGEDPQTGMDCSGLVQRVYQDLGYSLPRLAGDQVNAGTPVASLADAKPGDLLGFGEPMHHVGIYIGDNQMIEAPRPGLKVRIGPVWETPTHIGRIIGSDAPRTEATTSVNTVSSGSGLAAGTPYASQFVAAGRRYDVDPALLAAVAGRESGFRADAVSPAGAQGLMQLMPGTARGLGVTNSFDPQQAIDGAARMLKGLTTRFGSTELALAAYNAGPGAVTRYGGIPPYAETQHYVSAVMGDVRKYR